MANVHLDLTNPAHAYFFGFVQGDGHLQRSSKHLNKGKLQIELGVCDADVLLQFNTLFPNSSISYRTRDTNFRDDYHTVVWRLCDLSFRRELEGLGMPVGRKSLIVNTPVVKFSEIDYWRGLIDADGSLGFTRSGVPFLSFITTSQAIAEAYEKFLYQFTGKHKVVNRNRRDQAFNLMVTKEDAQTVIRALYYQNCLGLSRKIASATQVLTWVRPMGMKKLKPVTGWSPEEDAIVRDNSTKTAASILGRTFSSVQNRRFRLRARFVVKDNDQSAEGAA